MGQILHGVARTTAAVRRAIQHSQASLLSRAHRYGINPKTVHKWRRRSSVEDLPMGPKVRRSSSAQGSAGFQPAGCGILPYLRPDEPPHVHA